MPARQRQRLKISIHALLAESDFTSVVSSTGTIDFYPRSPCGERLHYDNYNLHCVEISIHALLAESDFLHCTTYLNCSLFLSTLSLRRATGPATKGDKDQIVFLSTLSLRRATPMRPQPPQTKHYFYPRSPCGERLPRRGTGACHRDFYPRSPCGERLCGYEHDGSG